MLLAGGVVLAKDSEGTDSPIAEGEFELRELKLTTGSTPPQLGQPLEIQLYNLNIVDPAFPDADLEVDFDDVRLDAAALPACFIELSQHSYPRSVTGARSERRRLRAVRYGLHRRES